MSSGLRSWRQTKATAQVDVSDLIIHDQDILNKLGKHQTLSTPFQNSTLPRTLSSSALSTSSTQNTFTSIPGLASTSSFSMVSSDRPNTQTSDVVQKSSSGGTGVFATTSRPTSSQLTTSSEMPLLLTSQNTSAPNVTTSNPTPMQSGQIFSWQSSTSLNTSTGETDSSSAQNHPNMSSSVLPSLGSSYSQPRSSPVSIASIAAKLGNSARPSATHASDMKGTQGWLSTQPVGSYGRISGVIAYSTKAFYHGTAAPSGKTSLPTMPLVTAMSGLASNSTPGQKYATARNITGMTFLGTSNSTLHHSMPSNSSLGHSTLGNLTLTNLTTMDNSTAPNSMTMNFTFSNTNFSNATLSMTSSTNSSNHNHTLANTLTNSTLLGGSAANSTLQNLTMNNSTLTMKSSWNSSFPSNSTLRSSTLTTASPSDVWYIRRGNSSIAVPWQPLYPTLRTDGGAAGYQLLTASQSTQCSGTVTKDIQKVTKTILTTTLIEETVTLYGDASIGDVSTPLPVYIQPLGPCSISYLPFDGHKKPGDSGATVTSQLLVTKKSSVIIRAPQTVGPMFNVPTTSAQPAPAQPASDSNQGELPQPQQAPSGDQGSGGSNGQSETQSSSKDLQPGSAHLQQVYPEEVPSVPANTDHSSSGNSGSDIKSAQPAGSNVQQPGGGQNLGSGGQTPNEGQTPGISQTSNGGSSSTGGDQGSAAGGSSQSGADVSSGALASGSHDQTSSEGQVSSTGSQSSSPEKIGDSGSGSSGGGGGTGQAASGGQVSSIGGQSSSPEQIGSGSSAGQTSSEEDVSNVDNQSSSPGTIGGTGGGSSGSGSSGSGSSSSPGSSGSSSGSGIGAGQTSSGNQASGDGGQISNPGQVDGAYSQTSNGQQRPKGEGQMPGGEQTVGSGSSTGSNGVQSVPTSEDSPSDSGQTNAAQSSSGQPNANGNISGTQNADSESIGSSDHRGAVGAGSNPSNSETTSQDDDTGDTGSSAGQNLPEIVTLDNVPVTIDDSAVVVGSQTISVGSPPTTIVANGQPIVVQPTQIIASGTTVPIKAAVTSEPAASTTMDGVPVVLHPNDIMIGSQSFEHGSSAAFAVYNGQTYSWDAKQLIGPGGTMISFPSATPAPQITAGGQVFSVYSSTLRASNADIPIPNTPTASPFIYKGQTFSVNPSQLIAPERNLTIPPTTQPTPFVYDGQTFSVDSSRFIAPAAAMPLTSGQMFPGDSSSYLAPAATMPLTSGSGTVRYGTQVLTIDHTRVICPTSIITLSDTPQAGTAAMPSAITTGGVAFSLGPQAAVVGTSTYSFLPGQTPATVTASGQTITLESNGVHFGSVNVPVPSIEPSYSAVTQGDLTFSVAPSAVVLGSQTYDVEPNQIPVHTVVDGQTISIGNQGVGLASTTIPLPMPSPSYAIVTEGDLTFSIAPSEAVVKGSTFAIGPSMPATMVLEGQTVSIGASEIHFPGTTVDIPTPTSQNIPLAVTADDLTFSVGPTDAVIGGTAYAIGSGAMAKTVVVGSETIRLGTNGVILPSTTIAPEQTVSAITADGLTFSADATEAIINGTAYAIGSEAIAKTIVVGSETIGLGTKGILLPSTTIQPWGNATQDSPFSTYGTAAASGNLPSAAATTAAPPPPTGLPGTNPEAAGGDAHRGAALRLRPPDMLTLALMIYGLSLGLLGLI